MPIVCLVGRCSVWKLLSEVTLHKFCYGCRFSFGQRMKSICYFIHVSVNIMRYRILVDKLWAMFGL